MTYYVPDDECVRTIPFGRVGENEYTTIAFDISSWQQNYTIDTVVLLIQRHGDTEAYPVLVDIQDNYAVHTLTATDMSKLGNGKCQLRMRSGDVIGKSRVYNTICLVSLDPSEEPPPAPVPGWLDHMEDLVAEAEGYAEDASQAATDAVEEKFADLTVEAEGLSPGSAPTVSYDDEANKITFGIPNASDVPTKTSDLTNDGENGTSRYVEEDEIANGKLVLRLLTGNACELNKFSQPYKTGCTAEFFHDLLDNRMNLLICGFPTDSTTKGYRYTIVEDKTTTHPGIPVSTHDYKLVLAAVADSSPTPFMRVAILTANDTDPYTGTYVDYPLYTDTEKTKLSGIAAGAQVNVIDTIKVNGTALTPDANKAVDISVPSLAPVVLNIIEDMDGTRTDFSYPDFKAAIASGNPVIFLYYDETLLPITYYVYTLKGYYDGYLNNRQNTIQLMMIYGNKTICQFVLTSPTGSAANMTPTYSQATLATVATSGSYNDLTNKPTIPAAQVNSDWNANSGVAQILNKPTIPAAQVNADWNAVSGVAQILNKPTIPAAQVNSDWDAGSGVAQILNKPTIPSKPTDLITVETMTSGDTAVTLAEGKFYIFPTMSSLAVTCSSSGMFAFRFTSGSTATNFSITGATMPDGFQVEANKVYEVNVLEGYGVAAEWSASP